jgi:hypothetical protein
MSWGVDLDSDEVRNDDGDTVVDAPLRWIAPEDSVTLDEHLAAEEPEQGYIEGPPPRPVRHRRQISGSPHDGPSFFTMERAACRGQSWAQQLPFVLPMQHFLPIVGAASEATIGTLRMQWTIRPRLT